MKKFKFLLLIILIEWQILAPVLHFTGAFIMPLWIVFLPIILFLVSIVIVILGILYLTFKHGEV